MAIAILEAMHECFVYPKTRAWEQQKLNKIKQMRKERSVESVKRRKIGKEKIQYYNNKKQMLAHRLLY